MNTVIPQKSTGSGSGGGSGTGNTIKYDNVVTVVKTNVSLFDEQILNGVSLTAGDRVLLVAQTDASENGIWVVVDGVYNAWTRPTDFPNGGEAEGAWTHVEQGTEDDESIWFCVTNGECTIDTDDQEWRNVNEDDVDGFNIADLVEVNTNAIGDYIAKLNSAGMKRISRNDFLRPGINEMTDESIVVINLANPERVFKVVLGGNRTLSVTNAKAGDRFLLNLVQDGTGSRTVTWFSTINWPGGSAPTLTPTADKADYLEFLCTGPNTYDGLSQVLNVGTATGSSEDPGGDIVAYWKLDETSGTRYDSVASYDLNVGEAGGYVGNLPGYDTGKISNGAFFDVSNSEHLDCAVAEGSSLDFQDSDFTFAFWLKVPTIDDAQYIFNLGPSLAYAYLRPDAQLVFTCFSSSGLTSFNTTGTVTAGSWVFVACVHDSVNDLMKVSFNGGSFETLSHSGGIRAVSGSGYFNLWTVNNFGENLDGYLDEFGIWNKALSLAEITDLYNSGSGKTYPFI